MDWTVVGEVQGLGRKINGIEKVAFSERATRED